MKRIWQGVIFPILIYIISTFVPALILELGGIEVNKVIGMFVGSIITFIILFLYSKYNKKLIVDVCFQKEEKLDIRRFIYIIPIGFSLSIVGNFILNIFNLDKIFPEGTKVTEELLSVNPILTIIVGGIMGPIVEEVIFRGYVYKSLKDTYNKKIAMIISSVLFAVIHGNIVQGIYAFACSFIFIYLYDECENILAPMCAHILANTSILFLGIGGSDINNMKFMHKILLIIVCGFLLSISIYRFYEFGRKGENYEKK